MEREEVLETGLPICHDLGPTTPEQIALRALVDKIGTLQEINDEYTE